MKLIKWTIFLGLGIACSLRPAFAQKLPETIVTATAEAQGLQLAPAPLRAGNFWTMLPGANGFFPVPFPCGPADPTAPVFSLPNGQFLVDESMGGAIASSAVLEDESNAVVNLIWESQTSIANDQAGIIATPPSHRFSVGGLGGRDVADAEANFIPDTNQLWLVITNVADGLASLDLYVPTNLIYQADQVYAIWATTNLASSWQVVAEVWLPNPLLSTNPLVIPFSLPTLGQPSLFVQAEDWTDVTENGNIVPNYWLWEYFGTTDLSDTNLDSQGNSLLYDYYQGADPDVISFTLAPNKYAASISTALQAVVSAGIPKYFAVLVDDTNFADANWMDYTSSNIAPNLGLSSGWHEVWVGLRGFDPNGTKTWQWEHVDLMGPPVLVITNPAADVVNQPTIQIYGYCQHSLASVSCDVSNALGIITNLPCEISDRYFDTNQWGFTTDTFECLDIPLTNGVNTLCFHATDLAGNVVATNFYYTLDYSGKTNPPSVQICWPKNGAQLSGNEFTLRGLVADPTVTISAQMVDSTGNTNVVSGAVERNGKFWVEDLPLGSGTNALQLTVTDVVGNTTVTNLSVSQAAVTLTINPVSPASQLWQPTVNLTGTISDPTYAVWVNGIKGTNYGNGQWSASNVPVNKGGTASFDATGYAPNELQPDGSYGN